MRTGNDEGTARYDNKSTTENSPWRSRQGRLAMGTQTRQLAVARFCASGAAAAAFGRSLAVVGSSRQNAADGSGGCGGGREKDAVESSCQSRSSSNTGAGAS